MTAVRLLSIGTAIPPGQIGQADSATLSRRLAPPPPAVPDGLIETLHRRTRIDRRGSVLVDPADGEQRFFPPYPEPPPTTAARMHAYAAHAGGLARESAERALRKAGIAPDRVSHLITVSCTGFVAPGVDQSLVWTLGLRPSIARTHVGFMGCHAALNALAVARGICLGDADATVLIVCVELCSLHLHTTERVDRLIANALFADGAAAALVAWSDDDARPAIRACRSLLLPDSAELMAWSIGDRGFEMTLDAGVPDRLAEVVPAWIDSVLDSCELRRADVGAWAIHPGGPRIVESLRTALGLSERATSDSLDVLRSHGNMSSPTVLFILERLLAREPAADGSAGNSALPRPWVAMAFGPGLAAECVVVE